VATGVVALLFQPLRGRLQRGVNRLFYGQRDDPLGALAQLGQRLEGTIDPEVVLPTLVETVAQTLKLPYVAIGLRTGDGFRPAAQAGNPVPEPLRLPLIYQGETVGELVVGPRGANEAFSESDRRLLANIAHQAGPAVHAVQLTAALQHSRLQLVTAREEERRRLRRDLHDGLGASLAGLLLEAGALRRAIRTDPDEAEALVDEFRTDIRATIDEIRRLVYELRPPMLDQLGLVAAVRTQAAQCSRGNGPDGVAPADALQVTVDAPEEFPPLPAAVEVAAYRIVQEALTNVVHHAQARHCHVRLELADALRLEVVDDGVGVPDGRSHAEGVGLLSMRERAVELGGTCLIEPAPGGGTRVLATLPLQEA
jgi:signal transduction histidine kinase